MILSLQVLLVHLVKTQVVDQGFQVVRQGDNLVKTQVVEINLVLLVHKFNTKVLKEIIYLSMKISHLTHRHLLIFVTKIQKTIHLIDGLIKCLIKLINL